METLVVEAAEGRADEQHRRKRAARGAGSQREPPGDEHRRERAYREAGRERVVDRVVPDTKRSRHQDPDRGEQRATDDWMPELADREAAIPAFDEEEPLADH